MSTFFEHTKELITHAAKIAKISDDMLSELQEPQHVHEFNISLERDDGSHEKLQAWRVQHNNALGPYKGGIRFHAASNLDEVKALAALMTWKTALMSLPYGGAKGAIRVNPHELSMRELEEVSRAYVRAVKDHIGPQKDVPAPDVGTNAQIMDWMADEYSELSGKWEPAAFTGKSIEKGGSKGREPATGFGGYVILKELLKLPATSHKLQASPTVAIQGFGNVGSFIAKYLFKEGFKIVAVSDSKGALYEPEGINIEKLAHVKEERGVIDRGLCYAVTEHGRPCQQFTNEDLLTLPVDILIPAALEHVVTEENASRVTARIILEMANGPVTPEAEHILDTRGIEIIPDILANGGGVVGSYFEWLQSLEQRYWSEEEVLGKIEENMKEAFKNAVQTKKEYNITWRQAAYVYALRRVVEGMK